MLKPKPQPEPQPDTGDTGGRKVESALLRQWLADSADMVFNSVSVNGNPDLCFTVAFVNGMADPKLVDDDVIKPLVQEKRLGEVNDEKELIELIMHGAVYHDQRMLRDKFDDCVNDILNGSVALVFDKSGQAVTFDIKGFDKRDISEPTNESVIKGSKEGFIEVLRVNTTLIRRRIQTRDLKIHQLIIGQRTNTAVNIVYIQGIANPRIVDELKRRLGAISTDSILAAGQIEAYIIDKMWSAFPQALYTERVDKFCANIMEGRVGILTDGLPIAYVVPVDINCFLQAPEDYALHFLQGSFFRMLRYLNALTSVLLPAFYVSITTFHQEMIPTELAIAIIQSKKGVPFPTFLEVILMLLAFEALLEAGLRLPKPIGQAVSIVGALVVGQAAISAKMLSPGVVIVVAAAGITGFIIPSQDLSNTLRMCRLLLVLCSIFAGLYGISLGLILLVYHLCTLESYGVPYVTPFAGNEGKQMLNDTILRMPTVNRKNRPDSVSPLDSKRQGG